MMTPSIHPFCVFWVVIKFQKGYFVIFLILLLVEIGIATFISGGFIRHYFGDFLVVIMIYCLIKSFFEIKPLWAAWIVLLIATAIEISQFFNLLQRMDWHKFKLARIILGNTFSYGDLIAYFMGIITVIIIENKYHNASS